MAQQETKTCSKCGEIKPLSEFYKLPYYEGKYRGQCKKCMYDYYIKKRLKTGKQKIIWKKCYSKKGEEYNRANVERKRRKRLMVLKHYSGGSPKCACCGETIVDFLSIDHINEDGAKHRNKGIARIANWLIKNNYPEGFQVLCWNCNWGRRVNNGVCPHQNLSKSEDLVKTYRNKRRMQVLVHYGGNPPKCDCCGESTFEFLTIDHIFSDGAKHRKEIGRGKIWTWLVENNFPDGFQVLCWNCNWGRYVNSGVCPHRNAPTKIPKDTKVES